MYSHVLDLTKYCTYFRENKQTNKQKNLPNTLTFISKENDFLA